MRKRQAAALTIGIIFLNMLATVYPVQAHFTLGNLTGTYRYHTNDFDQHVAGVIGYVWPGGGQNTFSGFRLCGDECTRTEHILGTIQYSSTRVQHDRARRYLGSSCSGTCTQTKITITTIYRNEKSSIGPMSKERHFG